MARARRRLPLPAKTIRSSGEAPIGCIIPETARSANVRRSCGGPPPPLLYSGCVEPPCLRHPLLRAVAAVAALAAAATIGAQAAADPAPALRICVLSPADLSDRAEASARGVGDAIAEIIEKRAAAGGLEVLPRERWAAAAAGTPERELVRGTAAVRLAAAAGADLVVTGFYRREGAGRALLQLKVYDVASRRIRAAVTEHSRSGLALYSASEAAADRLVAALKAPPPPPLSPSEPVERQQPGLARITLLSPDEGAEVLLAGEEPAGTVTGGIVTIEAPAGSTLDIEVRKPGFHPRRLTVGAQPEERLPALTPETRWSAGLLLTSDRLVGAGIAARRYLRPDRLFAGAEAYVYSPPSDDARGPGYRVDLRLLLGGHAPADPMALLRIGIASGLGVQVLNLLDSGPPVLDPYLSVASVGAEINLADWSAFARVEARYSLQVEDSSWGGKWQTWSLSGWSLPPFTLGMVRKIR